MLAGYYITTSGAAVVSVCTEQDQDPYATGSLIECCEGLTQVLGETHSYLCLNQTVTTVWNEEFDELDLSIWKPDIGGGGWGNGEKQIYSADPKYARIEDGVLILKAVKEADGNWYSAKYTTHGTKNFLYGRMETRVKLPATYPLNGAFPAIWMLGEKIHQGVNWPLCGEIDIFEYQTAFEQNGLSCPSTLHFQNNHAGNAYGLGRLVPNPADWHTFAIEWTEDRITAYQDDVQLLTYEKPVNHNYNSWPYGDSNNPFYFLVNLAIGPSFGSQPDNNIEEMEMYVDYIR
eukprot:Pgem_evm1s7702